MKKMHAEEKVLHVVINLTWEQIIIIIIFLSMHVTIR